MSSVFENEKDAEWSSIINDVLRLDECPIENTGDFKQDYINAMYLLINRIKNTTYREDTSKEKRFALINDLFLLGNMFYCFPNKINAYYEYTNQKEKCVSPFPFCEKTSYIVGSHNYNKYLNNITPRIFEEYYLLQVRVIKDFLDNDCQLTKYVYELNKVGEKFVIDKYEYITQKDLPISMQEKGEGAYLVPMYYPIIKINCTMDEYKEKILPLLKNEKHKKMFLEKEFPVIAFLQSRKS